MSPECDMDLKLGRYNQSLWAWAKVHQVPLDATFELTPFCNFRCPMCYVRLDPEHARAKGTMLTKDQWLELARQTRDLGTLNLLLTGGEPLMHPDFWEIYETCSQMGLLVSILSNGSLIDEEAIEHFRRFPPKHIKLSLYGASNETYEKMCGVKNGFDRVTRGIRLLQENNISFHVTSTVIRDNENDLGEMYRYTAEHHIPFFHTIAVANSARGALSQPLKARLHSKDFLSEWTLEKLEPLKSRPMYSPFAYCGNYGLTYNITWHGHMQFCSFVEKPHVLLKEPFNLAESWQEMLEQSRQIHLPPDCETCEYKEFCRPCPGLLAAESGDPCKASPGFCGQAAELKQIYDILKAQLEASGESEKPSDNQPADGENPASQGEIGKK